MEKEYHEGQGLTTANLGLSVDTHGQSPWNSALRVIRTIRRIREIPPMTSNTKRVILKEP